MGFDNLFINIFQAMLVGNFIALNMVLPQMELCHQKKQLEMTRFLLSSKKLDLESMFQELSLWTWSLLSSTRPELELTVNSTILSN